MLGVVVIIVVILAARDGLAVKVEVKETVVATPVTDALQTKPFGISW